MAQDFRNITIPLDVARNKLETPQIAGSYIQSIDVSSASALLQIGVNEADSEVFDFKRGFGWKNGTFNRCFLTNDAQPGEWVKIMYGGPTSPPANEFQAFPVASDANVVITGQSNDIEVDIAAQSLTKVDVDQVPQLLSSSASLNTGVHMSFNTAVTSWAVVYTVPATQKLRIRRGLLRASSIGSCKFSLDGVTLVRADTAVSSGSALQVFNEYILPEGTEIELKASSVGAIATLDLWSELTDA